MIEGTEKFWQEVESLKERVQWWMKYFDTPDGDGTLEPHPDFKNAPEGFDETAIEADLLRLELLLTTMHDYKENGKEFGRTLLEGVQETLLENHTGVGGLPLSRRELE